MPQRGRMVDAASMKDHNLLHAVLQKGFRPFFLLGGLYGAALVAWWARTYDDTLDG